MKKQKVLLVRASYLESHMQNNIVPPLGVLTLAAVLRKERPLQVEVRVLDSGIERKSPREVGDVIRQYEPDVVGISGLTVESRIIHGIAAAAKLVNPSIKTVIGGPHSTTFYDHALKDPNIDYAVIGEGERTIVELLDIIRDGEAPKSAPQGLAFMRDGQVVYGGDRPFEEDLDSIPMPAWDMIDLMPYTSRLSMQGMLLRKPYASLFTSRACPYRCVYCHGIFGKRFRAQSPERVLAELELLQKQFGVTEFHFYDDVFNFDKGRASTIMEGVISRGWDLKFAFPNGIRSDILTRELVATFARAGVYGMTFAIETASPRIQRLIKKNLNLEKARQSIEWAFEEGIIPSGFFMLGFPTETLDEMKETIRFANRSKLLLALFFLVTPFPRSELAQLVREHYPEFKIDYDFSPNLHYWSDEPYYAKISGIDLTGLRKVALRTFFTNPWRLYHQVRLFPRNLTWLYPLKMSLNYWLFGWGRGSEKLDIATSPQ